MDGDLFNISQHTISRIFARVSFALASLRPKFIFLPDKQEALAIQKNCYDKFGFPGACGTIDGTHINGLFAGEENREIYRDRKGNLSLNVQVIADFDQIFRDVVVRWPGSAHDSRVLDNSRAFTIFASDDKPIGWLLGDAGYMCRPWLMTPFKNPSNTAEGKYNYSHARARNTIERMFGGWKKRFYFLAKEIRVRKSTMMAAVVACAVVWNFLKKCQDEYQDNENEETASELNINESDYSVEGNILRLRIVRDYFTD